MQNAKNTEKTVPHRKARAVLSCAPVACCLFFLAVAYLAFLGKIGIDSYSDIPFRKRDDIGDVICAILLVLSIIPITAGISFDEKLDIKKALKWTFYSFFSGLFMYLLFFVTHRGIHLIFVDTFAEGVRFISSNLLGMLANGMLFAVWIGLFAGLGVLAQKVWMAFAVKIVRDIMMLILMTFWFFQTSVDVGEYLLIYTYRVIFHIMSKSIAVILLSLFFMLFLGLLIVGLFWIVRGIRLGLSPDRIFANMFRTLSDLLRIMRNPGVRDEQKTVRLAGIITPGDILRAPALSLDYYRTVSRHQRLDLTRDGGSAVVGDLLIVPYGNMAEAEKRRYWFEKQIQLFLTGFSDAVLDERQQQAVLRFLLQKRSEGYLVSVISRSKSAERLFGGKSELTERILKTSIPIRRSYRSDPYMPFGAAYGEDTERSRLLLDMSQTAAKIPDEDMRNTFGKVIEECRTSSGDVAIFYSLLKLAETVLHLLWLKCLCAEPSVREGSILRPAAGDMVTKAAPIVRTLPSTDDRNVINSARYLENFAAKGNAGNSIRSSAMSFGEAANLSVQLRNRFVGHGVMAYSVTQECIQPLIMFTSWILSAAAPHLAINRDQTIPVKGKNAVPAMRHVEGRPYYFNGYKGHGVVSYLSFAEGDSFLCSDTEDMHKVTIPLQTEWEGGD